MAEKPGRWDVYKDAVLRIEAPGGAIWVRRLPILQTAGDYPDPDGRTIYVITAHNPGGRLAPGAENAAAQARLAAELERRGLTWWPAAGGNPSWKHVEASAAVVGIDAAGAIALGTQFGQDVIFALSPQYRQVLDCAGRRVTSTGWSIEPEPDVAAVASERWLPEWVTASVEEDKDADDAQDSEPRDERTVSTEDPRTSHDSVPRQTTEPADLPDAGGVASERAASRRAEDRSQRVADGLAELSEWLRDQVRVGLAASAHAAGKKSGGADEMAARMVDAQAPGVAGSLRGLSRLPGTGVDWPSRLLSSYAMLHLLIRAHERLDLLPDGLAANVRARVGYRIGRNDVLARPAITDHWLVLGTRDLDGAVLGRRIWLRGQDTGRFAMVLTFARNTYGSWQDWDTAKLTPGTLLHASLHFYPGEPPMRAIIGERLTAPVPAKPPVPDRDINAMLADYAAGIEQDPWLTIWPAVLDGTPMPPEPGSGEPWYLVDQAGTALPLAAEQGSPWKLLVISDGLPVTAAGEWHPGGLVLLTAWQGDKKVML